ncbi:ClpXP protease specificity-enhancing factor [Aliikangiella sp. G2MR2-5]|uniref:ClpXP protease specificity-enhancing factor n=1 Tax=Aliikangiella sp. G2MR2-5 TaxID=2788943 RepID=UPI0018AA4E48|nr:ClpXP protease specificity-enhancing factor [Aliikangiella sp. G2MR2-5]
MHEDNFSSNKPYLFRAIYEWILDNGATPYILVDTTQKNVDVPVEHIQNDQIVLNASPGAVRDWFADNDAVSFSARFSGKSRQIYVPMNAILAIYAQENGQGMAFPVLETEEADESEEIVETDALVEDEPNKSQGLKAVESPTSSEAKDSRAKGKAQTDDKSGDKGRSGSHLKVIK